MTRVARSDRVALTGWGRVAPTVASLTHPRSGAEVAELLAEKPPRGAIPRGLGRAYGDAAQDAGGLVLDCTSLAPNRVIDPETGIVTAGAGVSLGALLRELVPLGWFVPVTPGTRYVTVGGAIAADIHGKNHHADGSFGGFLRSITVVTPDGETRRVGPDSDPELFRATVGGMGLTGVITEATFRAVRIETARMRVDTERARDLDHAMEIMADTDDRYRYTVAWIDLLARGGSMGRSVLTRGDHATADELPARQRREPLDYGPRNPPAAPPWVPNGLLNRWTVRAFNELWFHKAPRERQGEIQTIPEFFHPLDLLARWNTLYGSRGLIQYQPVVPLGAEDALRRIVERLSSSRVTSFLTVLKRFGPAGSGMMSFPMAGWTLSLDVPAGVPGLGPLLAELDRLVVSAGGRVYLAKDSVLSAELLPRMYPQVETWQRVRHRVDPAGVLRSDLARRLAI